MSGTRLVDDVITDFLEFPKRGIRQGIPLEGIPDLITSARKSMWCPLLLCDFMNVLLELQ